MKNPLGIGQFILRIALGLGFILPVMDRTGLLGAAGKNGVSWGDWAHFIAYTHTLLPVLNNTLTNLAALIATLAEVVFGFCLIIGFRIRQISLGAALLTLFFGICMAITQGIGAPFKYPVFVFTGAAMVLSGLGNYLVSIDACRSKDES